MLSNTAFGRLVHLQCVSLADIPSDSDGLFRGVWLPWFLPLHGTHLTLCPGYFDSSLGDSRIIPMMYTSSAIQITEPTRVCSLLGREASLASISFTVETDEPAVYRESAFM